MLAHGGGCVELPVGVMDRVDQPQRAPEVAKPMERIAGEIGGEQPSNDERPERQAQRRQQPARLKVQAIPEAEQSNADDAIG